MATSRASPDSCHSPPEFALSKLVTHLSFASSSQHDVGATRIGRRKAPAQFPFRSTTPSASLDDDSVWGLVLLQSRPPPTTINAYEASWDAATSISSDSPGCSQAAEFSSSYSPEAITRECHLSKTQPSWNRYGTTPPDPVPNPMCPEDHACIPVSWTGENRGKGVAVGDGSVCLLERSGMGYRILSDPADKPQIGVIPIIPHERWGDASQCGTMELASTKPKREFPGREFRNDLDDEKGAGAGTDEVFWRKSTTRKPTPAAAWDWDRMSSHNISSAEPSPSKEALLEVRGERPKSTRAPNGPAIDYIRHPNVGAGCILSTALPLGNDIVALARAVDTIPIGEVRQEGAVRRLKSIIGHLTGIITSDDPGHYWKVEQVSGVISED